jgi:hypothetical protein
MLEAGGVDTYTDGAIPGPDCCRFGVLGDMELSKEFSDGLARSSLIRSASGAGDRGSSGIGLELARQFAAHGFDLVITGSGNRVDDAAASLRQAGATVVPVRSDLATYDGVEAVWEAVQDTGRPLAAAALNAGIGIGGASSTPR